MINVQYTVKKNNGVVILVTEDRKLAEEKMRTEEFCSIEETRYYTEVQPVGTADVHLG